MTAHFPNICMNNCRKLQLGYVDLYLIHWPFSLPQEETKFPIDKEKVLPIDYKSVWEAMEECQALGLAKSIGVSNFSCKKLDQLLSTARIPPAVNQVSWFTVIELGSLLKLK